MMSFFNRAGWVIAGVLALLVVASLAGVVRGGPLDPPGAPASTLSEIEPRTALHPPPSPAALPIIISAPGSYYLAGDINGSASAAIRIDVNDVTLDLNGFTVQGALTGTAIFAQGARQHITIRNGNVHDWDTGLNFNDDSNVVIEGVNVSHGLSNGVELGANSLLRDCELRDNAAGVRVDGANSVVRDCRAIENRYQGIDVEAAHAQILDNFVQGNGTAGGCCTGIWLNSDSGLADGNIISANPNYGMWVSGGSGIAPPYTTNRVVRNTFRANGLGAINRTGYCLSDGECDIGPLEFGASTTYPYANLQN